MGYKKEEKSDFIELKNAIQERLEEKNTDIFRAIKRIAPITRILCENSTGTIFLNRKDFKKVYPALLTEEFKKSKVNLIVSADVLLYEKEEEKNPYSFFLGDKFARLTPEESPSLSKIQRIDKIFVAAPQVQCDSFMIFNNRSYILKIENEDPYFSCSLNAPYKQEFKERLTLLTNLMQKIKTLSVPFHSLKQTVTSHKRRNNRLDEGRQYE